MVIAMMTAGALEFPEDMSEFNVEDVKSQVKAWFSSKLDGEEGRHVLDTLGRSRTAIRSALKERKIKKRDKQKKKKDDEKTTSVKIKELRNKHNELF